MTLLRSIVPLLLLNEIFAAPALARQQPSLAPIDDARPSVAPGTRIRIQVPGYGRGLFRTTVVGLSGGVLQVRTHPKTPISLIPIDSIIRLQLENGSRSRVGPWGLRGLAFGGALGAFVRLATGHLYEDRPCTFHETTLDCRV